MKKGANSASSRTNWKPAVVKWGFPLLSALGAIYLAIFVWKSIFQIPLPFILEPDSMGYIHPFLSFYDGQGFIPSCARTLGYAFWLIGLTSVGLDIPGVIRFQIALLAVLPLIGLSWGSWRWLHRAQSRIDFLDVFAGSTIVISILFSAHHLIFGYAHALMPETFYQITLVLSFVFFIVFLYRKTQRHWFFLLSWLFCFFSMILKPHSSALFLALSVAGVVLFVVWWRRNTPSSRFFFGGISLCAFVMAILFLVFQQTQQLTWDGYVTRTFSKKILFCFASEPVVRTLRKLDPASLEISSEQKDGIIVHLEEFNRRGGMGMYRLLNFNGDLCLSDPKFDARIKKIFEPDPDGKKESRFFTRVYLSALMHEPIWWLKKVILQYGYAILRFNYLHDREHTFSGVTFKNEGPPLRRWIKENDLLLDGTLQGIYPINTRFDRVASKMINFLQILMPVIILGPLILLYVRVRARRRWDWLPKEGAQYVYNHFYILLFYLFALATPAIAHSFDVWRYLVAVYGVALLVIAHGIALLIWSALDFRRKGNSF